MTSTNKISSVEFVKRAIDRIVSKMPSLRCRYEYQSAANTHFIEVVPTHTFKVNDEYIKLEESVADSFDQAYPMESICFITDDSHYKITQPSYCKEGALYRFRAYTGGSNYETSIVHYQKARDVETPVYTSTQWIKWQDEAVLHCKNMEFLHGRLHNKLSMRVRRSMCDVYVTYEKAKIEPSILDRSALLILLMNTHTQSLGEYTTTNFCGFKNVDTIFYAKEPVPYYGPPDVAQVEVKPKNEKAPVDTEPFLCNIAP